MRTNITLKTKAMSILLAIVMLLGMLPISVFAADESTVITINNFNVNAESDAYYLYDSSPVFCLVGGHTFRFVKDEAGDTFALASVNVESGATVLGDAAKLQTLANYGTISGGDFNPHNVAGLTVQNREGGVISGGTFNGNNTYSLTVENAGTISGGTFYGLVTNTGTISDGTFNGLVTNTGAITGGTFTGKILNMGGTVADGVNGTVAQGGDLAITMQTLGTGSITVKQKGIDIPSGKAGETYNVAASGGTLVGLYMLTGDETVPTGNYTIESDFRAVLGGAGSYDFTMPNEAVTIVAVFDGYEPTEVNFFTNIIRGTDETSLKEAEWYGGIYLIPSLYSFTEDTVLPGDAVPATITHNSELYDFAGFIMSDSDAETGTESFYLVETLTIPAEPAYGTTAWEEWKASVPEGLNAAYMLHTHSYSAATCKTPATCSCGATTGGVDSTNHTGRTEVRGQKDATEFEEGYTGDTYCLGCNTVIKQGEVIGATHTHSYTKEAYHSTGHYTECDCGEKTELQAHSYTGILDATCDCGYNRGLFVTNDDGKDFFEVGFIPGDGVTLPDDAELVVGEHYPSLAPIASTIVPTAETEYVDIPEENISRLDDIVDAYKPGEIVVIDGEKYMVCVGADEIGYLIRLSDKAKFIYHVQKSILAQISMSYDVEIQTNRTIVINGAKYDVPATITHNGIEQYAVLYVDGVQAGLYIPSNNEASFCEGYDPETLKAQQDDNDLGSVTIPADYSNAAIADLAPGKTYKVSVIGSNDISVEGYDDALLNSITEDTPEIAAAKAELERLKADVDAKMVALTRMNIMRLCEYLEHVRINQCFEPKDAITDWRDYLHAAKTIEVDLTDNKARYPSSLKREHDRAVAKQKLVLDAKKDEFFQAETERYGRLYSYKTDEYMIVPPKDMKDLFEEGRKLNHCVGSYSDRIVEGKTCIMFIRKTEEPDKPYFTIEINQSNSYVVQLRANSNRGINHSTEKELVKFLKEWSKKKNVALNGAA